MSGSDTIFAPATALGGALAVLRISGSQSLAIALKLWHGRANPGDPCNFRRLLLGRLADLDGTAIDSQCLLAYMPSPHSYTGEDVAELHCHGGVLACRLALEALQKAGARPATPGEFTRRAFLNGKLDLTQAEAVADLISAESAAALSSANCQLSGHVGRQIGDFYSRLETVLAEVESRLDFPDEELEWIPVPELSGQIGAMRDEMRRLWATRRAGEVIRNGITMVIAGEPNVGKSSLLNRWIGRDRAIVSEIPGTTRDTVEADFVVRGIPVRLIDTAGVRESADAIEQCGMERSHRAAADADLVLWVADAAGEGALAPWPQWPVRAPVLLVANKCDIASRPVPDGYLAVSAKDGTGIDELSDAVARAVIGDDGLRILADCAVAVSARHAALLEEAADALDEAMPSLDGGEWELAAVPLRRAMAAIGQITGKAVSPDVLDAIFHRFCIGK